MQNSEHCILFIYKLWRVEFILEYIEFGRKFWDTKKYQTLNFIETANNKSVSLIIRRKINQHYSRDHSNAAPIHCLALPFDFLFGGHALAMIVIHNQPRGFRKWDIPRCYEKMKPH